MLLFIKSQLPPNFSHKITTFNQPIKQFWFAHKETKREKKLKTLTNLTIWDCNWASPKYPNLTSIERTRKRFDSFLIFIPQVYSFDLISRFSNLGNEKVFIFPILCDFFIIFWFLGFVLCIQLALFDVSKQESLKWRPILVMLSFLQNNSFCLLRFVPVLSCAKS